MRIGSLFSGIGGLELGLEWAGVGHTVWQVERDPFCRKVLAKHWPDAQRFEDVRDVGAHNLRQVDVICGWYPCQPFSQAGKRRGTNDPRHLWPEFARIIRELRPRFAVLENVRAHLTLGFDEVLGDLAQIGYDAEWSVLSARGVGAPHKRERLFVVAYSNSNGRDAAGRTQGSQPEGTEESRATGGAVHRIAARGTHLEETGGARWAIEPDVGRMVDGVPGELDVDRLSALGNAVVPQVAQVVGHRLLQIAATLDSPRPVL